MEQNNDYRNQAYNRHQSYNKRKLMAAEDYISRGEIETDNYDKDTRNYIDKNRELPKND